MMMMTGLRCDFLNGRRVCVYEGFLMEEMANGDDRVVGCD